MTKDKVTRESFGSLAIRESEKLLNDIASDLGKDSVGYKYALIDMHRLISVCAAIDNLPNNEDYRLDNLHRNLEKLWNTGILSPLTLKDDEFNKIATSDNIYRNKRYPSIFKLDGRVYRLNAFGGTVRAVYDAVTSEQIRGSIETFTQNIRVYIAKGGIVTGDYFVDTIIRPEVVDRGVYTVQSSINLPVSMILDGELSIYTIDHREPKFKALQEFYYVPIEYDENVKLKKYFIRSYKKLDK